MLSACQAGPLPGCLPGLQVDQRNEAVLLPIYGIMVPFHILTIKNATNNQDGDHSYIRINFNFGPGFEPGARFPNAIFLKELSFRSADTRHSAKARPPSCPDTLMCSATMGAAWAFCLFHAPDTLPRHACPPAPTLSRALQQWGQHGRFVCFMHPTLCQGTPALLPRHSHVLCNNGGSMGVLFVSCTRHSAKAILPSCPDTLTCPATMGAAWAFCLFHAPGTPPRHACPLPRHLHVPCNNGASMGILLVSCTRHSAKARLPPAQTLSRALQ